MTDHLLSQSRELVLSVQGRNKLLPGGRCLAMSQRTLVFGTVFCESREGGGDNFILRALIFLGGDLMPLNEYTHLESL